MGKKKSSCYVGAPAVDFLVRQQNPIRFKELAVSAIFSIEHLNLLKVGKKRVVVLPDNDTEPCIIKPRIQKIKSLGIKPKTLCKLNVKASLSTVGLNADPSSPALVQEIDTSIHPLTNSIMRKSGC